MINRLLPLFQLCDSSLPTGAFSHSFGLETYIQTGAVTDGPSFEEWLVCYVQEQLAYTDGLVCRMTYDALDSGEMNEIGRLGQLLHIQNLPRETRQGSRMMGERMLKLTVDLFDLPLLHNYQTLVSDGRTVPHPAIVFTIIAYEFGCSREEAILYYLYSSISGLVQNAVRAIPLGQTAGQHILYRFGSVLQDTVEKILGLSEDDFGIVAPGLELSQMQHERVNVRIFMS
ncbi:urease accessory protein UreF [Sporosarcina sp. 179-K 3D1 HS]|uniref:urease accessory protein UreF n=1 Tax=Sporosarcina sp. 179-K 3D1 HS TaxID=3232169 RepID=UPI0039A0B731